MELCFASYGLVLQAFMEPLSFIHKSDTIVPCK